MKPRRLFISLGLLPAMLAFTACDDDNETSWPNVDGGDPVLELTTDLIRTEPGKTFHIKGTITDKDGIAAIDLDCPALELVKTIDIITLYEKPLETYELDYKFTTDKNEIADRFTINVSVTDVGGRKVSKDLVVSLDNDFNAPTFTTRPSDNVTVLIKNETSLRVKFGVQDDKALGSIRVEIPSLGVSEEVTEFNGGRKSHEYNNVFTVPSLKASYAVNVTVKDISDNEASFTTTYNIDEMPDFSKMWLADVEDAAALNSDAFGVPMTIWRTGPFKYEARYYNAKAGTKVFFLPQDTDFSPICFGLDPDDNTKLADDPELSQPFVLDQAGVYYKFNLDIKASSYTISTYTIAESTNPMPHTYNAVEQDTWENGNPDDFMIYHIGLLTSRPNDISTFLEQDSENPNILYTAQPLAFEAGDEFNFYFHNQHWHEWWDYSSWKVNGDRSDDSVWYYTGKFANSAYVWPYDRPGNLDWAHVKIPSTGSYNIYFDTHLGQARMVKAN